MFTIELTRGASWQAPVETIDHRECLTDSIASAVAEAKYWLEQNLPQRGATHYRVVSRSGTIVGGPP